MLQILSANETATLIADLHEQDPHTTRETVGAMDIHSGNHAQRGRVTVICEISKGDGVVFPTPRATLSLATAKTLAA